MEKKGTKRKIYFSKGLKIRREKKTVCEGLAGDVFSNSVRSEGPGGDR